MILPLTYYPWQDEQLRQVSQSITTFDQNLKTLAQDMLDTLEHNQGIGLAAPQVGVLQRIFVMTIEDRPELPQIFINPKIRSKSQELIEYEEGCLSIPEYRSKISRAKEIQISAYDINGDSFTLHLQDLAGICAQHEIDHLDGILFIDYLSSLKRNRLRKKMLKAGTPTNDPTLI